MVTIPWTKFAQLGCACTDTAAATESSSATAPDNARWALMAHDRIAFNGSAVSRPPFVKRRPHQAAAYEPWMAPLRPQSPPPLLSAPHLGGSTVVSGTGSTTPIPSIPANYYWALAVDVQLYIRSNFLLGSRSPTAENGGFPNGGYRGSIDLPDGGGAGEPGPDQAWTWYIASQISADAMMARTVSGYRLYAIDGAEFLISYLCDTSRNIGGYFAFLDLRDAQGIAALAPVDLNSYKYIDDNARVGLAFLDVAELVSGNDNVRYIQAARDVADFIIASRDKLRGGLWWAVLADGTGYAKWDGCVDAKHSCAYSSCDLRNAIACGPTILLLLRLYHAGFSDYGPWAYEFQEWIDNNLFDSNTGLYNAENIYDTQNKKVGQCGHWADDNAIMVEVMLTWSKIGSTSQPWLDRAVALATAMTKELLQNAFVVTESDANCAKLGALGPLVPRWSSWAARAMILLYENTLDSMWLDYAQTSIDFLNDAMRIPPGYWPVRCSVNEAANKSFGKDACDQAWMQHTLAMLSRYRSAEKQLSKSITNTPFIFHFQ